MSVEGKYRGRVIAPEDIAFPRNFIAQHIRKHATTGLLTIGLLVTLAASLEADDRAYMLGTAALGVQNPLYTPNRTDSFIRSTRPTQVSPSSEA
jgi:hypothetical protein